MATKDDQTLGTKEAALFRQVVKFYENKLYKKGIKAADTVSRLPSYLSRNSAFHVNHNITES